ncbi:uncharacterized protein TNCV_4686561 [Trichonephila clavipes]|nr:uncharacterized protein TNCV_4686561 [Trichonephila clavipes]
MAGFVTSLNPVPLKTRRVRERCTLNLSRAQTSSRWCSVVVRRGVASSGVVHVILPWFKNTWSVAKSPRVAEQCDVNIHSCIPNGKEGKFPEPETATRGLLATDHIILNHGQVTWTTLELTTPSPNYHTTPGGGRLSSRQI